MLGKGQHQEKGRTKGIYREAYLWIKQRLIVLELTKLWVIHNKQTETNTNKGSCACAYFSQMKYGVIHSHNQPPGGAKAPPQRDGRWQSAWNSGYLEDS